MSLFRGKKKVVENGDVDVISSSDKSASQDDLQEKDGDFSKEAKKSMLSLFYNKQAIGTGGTMGNR